MQGRYDREYKYGNVSFPLSDFELEPEQCRFLMLKILGQAVNDYCSLAGSNVPSEQQIWELAKEFIFDDDYRVVWGSIEISFEEFLDFIDFDVSWVRMRTTRRFNEEVNNGKKKKAKRRTRR